MAVLRRFYGAGAPGTEPFGPGRNNGGGDRMNSGKNNKSIGCEVTSCRFNSQGSECGLERIEVRPSCDCHSGDCHEANCGSYAAK